MNCEICGFFNDKLYKADIEGAVLTVCEDCAKNGKILEEVNQARDTGKNNHHQLQPGSFENELRLDYPAVISNAMKEKGLTVEMLADELKESRLEIKKVVEGKLGPTDDIAKRLEKRLGVSLFEKVYTGAVDKTAGDSLTFADVVKMNDKHKQG